MAVIDTVRVLVRDSATVKRFTDTELNTVIAFAIGEVNAWANTTYVLADYTNLVVPVKYNQLMLLICKIWAMQMDIQDTSRYVKFVTQDVQYDPSELATRLNRTLSMLQKDLELKLKKWIGLDVCGYVAIPTEYTEVT